MRTAPTRLAGVDGLKAIASQLIVVHHLAFYGPMSDIAMPLAPDLIGALSQYGRWAVQVFLALGGFLAARSLAPQGVLLAQPVHQLLSRRYLRLVLPFVAALLIAMLAASLARQLLQHSAIPLAPGAAQFAAHVFLLHGVLGSEALSAGVWYVAIDFQLFALLVAVLWCGRRLRARRSGAKVSAVCALLMASASVLYFNRDAEWDNWAVYFFGSYCLGAMAWWAHQDARLRYLWWALVMVVLAALVLDFRGRIAVALLTAMYLLLAQRQPVFAQVPMASRALIAWLGRISYAVFLVHFPVCLLANMLMARYVPPEPWLHALGMLLAWALSIVAGASFHRYVERPAMRWAGHMEGWVFARP